MPKRFVRALLCLAALAAPAVLWAQNQIQPARRIVVFRSGISPANRIRVIEQSGGKVTHDLRIINAVGVAYPANRLRMAEAGLLARPDVLRIETDFEQNWLKGAQPASLQDLELPSVRSFLLPHGIRPRSSEQDAEIPWGVERVKAPAAWSAARGAGVKVAVIDTGVDFNHPELTAAVKGGWNATDPAAPDAYVDDNGHGTHVAGTIAAAKDGQGVVGVAPGVSLYGVKVLNAWGSGTFADVIAGMQWAADNKMDVANMSLGASQGTEALADAAKAVAKAGVVIVAAAGNSYGAVGYPAAYPEVIAVSASDVRDALADFSSRGPEVDFVAPGVDVKSTYLGGAYEDLSGTSMACPHVAGLAAIAIAARGVRGEAAVRAALASAAAPIEGLTPEQQGAGMVDASKLVPAKE